MWIDNHIGYFTMHAGDGVGTVDNNRYPKG